jgi:hypothetical protein
MHGPRTAATAAAFIAKKYKDTSNSIAFRQKRHLQARNPLPRTPYCSCCTVFRDDTRVKKAKKKKNL